MPAGSIWRRARCSGRCRKNHSCLPPWHPLSLVYVYRRDFPKAIDTLNRLLQASPAFYDAYNLLGMIYTEQGNYQLAKEKLLLAANAAEYLTRKTPLPTWPCWRFKFKIFGCPALCGKRPAAEPSFRSPVQPEGGGAGKPERARPGAGELSQRWPCPFAPTPRISSMAPGGGKTGRQAESPEQPGSGHGLRPEPGAKKRDHGLDQ